MRGSLDTEKRGRYILPMSDPSTNHDIQRAADAIAGATYFVAFTGAGISVESGIPPFRGEGGIWERYDPQVLQLGYFHRHPKESWDAIRAIFYEFFGKAEPNEAHRVLAEWEQEGYLDVLITQNIDNLHHKAGSRKVVEYHGNSSRLVCPKCGTTRAVTEDVFDSLPPRCGCGGVWKPDFVFFGEGIPAGAARESERAAEKADVMLLVGTTGEVYPAAYLPQLASYRGAVIVEVNPSPSYYTDSITDVHVPLRAAEALSRINAVLTDS